MSSGGKFPDCFVINPWRGWWRLRVINREGGGAIAMQAACVLHHPSWSAEVGWGKSTNKR